MERQYRHALGCTCYELPCDATEELEVHLLTREEVCSVLHNNEMMLSLMVAPLLKYLSPELK